MSDESGLDHNPAISAADLEVIRAAAIGDGVAHLGPGDLQALMESVKETRAGFEALLPSLSPERAAFVRRLRVDAGYTWRAVAETCHIEWAGQWEPPSNQIMGMVLCERAAQIHGENPNAFPWN